MKPIKNKIFCMAIGRPKMLFKTKKNADNCIKFNGNEIFLKSGKKPCRSYYCILCGGWHITSVDSSKSARYFDNRVNAELNLYHTWKERNINRKTVTPPERAVVLSSFLRE